MSFRVCIRHLVYTSRDALGFASLWGLQPPGWPQPFLHPPDLPGPYWPPTSVIDNIWDTPMAWAFSSPLHCHVWGMKGHKIHLATWHFQSRSAEEFMLHGEPLAMGMGDSGGSLLIPWETILWELSFTCHEMAASSITYLHWDYSLFLLPLPSWYFSGHLVPCKVVGYKLLHWLCPLGPWPAILELGCLGQGTFELPTRCSSTYREPQHLQWQQRRKLRVRVLETASRDQANKDWFVNGHSYLKS